MSSVPLSLLRAGRNPKVPHMSPAPYPLYSLSGATHKKAPTARMQSQIIISSQGCQVQLPHFLPDADSPVFSLSLVGNYFSGENVDGQGGVRRKTKKGRRADTKTVLLDLR